MLLENIVGRKLPEKNCHIILSAKKIRKNIPEKISRTSYQTNFQKILLEKIFRNYCQKILSRKNCQKQSNKILRKYCREKIIRNNFQRKLSEKQSENLSEKIRKKILKKYCRGKIIRNNFQRKLSEEQSEKLSENIVREK